MINSNNQVTNSNNEKETTSTVLCNVNNCTEEKENLYNNTIYYIIHDTHHSKCKMSIKRFVMENISDKIKVLDWVFAVAVQGK